MGKRFNKAQAAYNFAPRSKNKKLIRKKKMMIWLHKIIDKHLSKRKKDHNNEEQENNKIRRILLIFFLLQLIAMKMQKAKRSL
jgi:hypothetical protein